MPPPLVSVICLCYNHERFIREALESVFHQTYPHIQIIIVDDASTDNSVANILKIVEGRPVDFLPLRENGGNCKAFNEGLALARGEFVVDFATDDVMLPERIARQVAHFQSQEDDYGVVFSDADYVDEDGKLLRHHYDYLFRKGLLKTIPQGDVYASVVSRYFIASPTMMIRRSVLEKLGGYDETLAYEDFDFWVRSARTFKYACLNERLTKIRKSDNSLSTGWYKQGDKQLHSTYLVCRKAQKLNQNKGDVNALIQRVRFELRQSVFSQNKKEAVLFFELLKELTTPSLPDILVMSIRNLPLPYPWLRNVYHAIRYGS